MAKRDEILAEIDKLGVPVSEKATIQELQSLLDWAKATNKTEATDSTDFGLKKPDDEDPQHWAAWLAHLRKNRRERGAAVATFDLQLNGSPAKGDPSVPGSYEPATKREFDVIPVGWKYPVGDGTYWHKTINGWELVNPMNVLK